MKKKVKSSLEYIFHRDMDYDIHKRYPCFARKSEHRRKQIQNPSEHTLSQLRPNIALDEVCKNIRVVICWRRILEVLCGDSIAFRECRMRLNFNIFH